MLADWERIVLAGEDGAARCSASTSRRVRPFVVVGEGGMMEAVLSFLLLLVDGDGGSSIKIFVLARFQVPGYPLFERMIHDS